MPHTHKDKQVHPDESFVHHHALTDHEPPSEHHPECKLPYYGGGFKGCIDRCEVGKKKGETKMPDFSRKGHIIPSTKDSLSDFDRQVEKDWKITEETFNDEEEMLMASEAYAAEIFEGRNPDRFKTYALPSFLSRDEK